MSDDGASVEGTLQHSERPADAERLSTEAVQRVNRDHGAELLAFLIGVLRNVNDANEVSQIAFHRLLEIGHTANEVTIKGWLFKVALHEALDFRRKQIRHDRHLKEYLSERQPDSFVASAIDEIVQSEDVSRLKHLLTRLPDDQQHVVRQRIYEEKTFATIAAELDVPVGTLLTRMRLALEKLRKWLGDE